VDHPTQLICNLLRCGNVLINGFLEKVVVPNQIISFSEKIFWKYTERRKNKKKSLP
jgi:hypothetical protein